MALEWSKEISFSGLKKGKTKFSEFFEGATSRSQLVATFLAMLELVKANRVKLSDDNTVVTLNRKKRGTKESQTDAQHA